MRFFLLLVLLPRLSCAGDEVDRRLPSFIPSESKITELRSHGSDCLWPVMRLWAERLAEDHPGLEYKIESKGGAVNALAKGLADIGPMSRPYKPDELECLRDLLEERPKQILVGRQEFSLLVHAENPITSVSLAELDAMFSLTRRRGAPGTILTWGQLGLTNTAHVAWADMAVQPWVPSTASHEYGFLRKEILFKGEPRPGLMQLIRQDSSVIAANRGAIGLFMGQRFASGTRRVACSDKDVVLCRDLLVSVPPQPSAAALEFFRLVFSREGQHMLWENWCTPLSFEEARKQAARLGLVLEPDPRPLSTGCP